MNIKNSNEKSLKIIFAGTQDFSVTCLSALLKTKHKIIGVLTASDKPKGRGNKIAESPVKILAKNYKIPIFQPDSLNEIENYKWFKKEIVDLIIVVAYKLIFSKSILNMSRLGCINVHCSILPKWRGAAPIQRSICAGDDRIGVSIIQMDEGIDTGDIIYKSIIYINQKETTATLYKKLSIIAPGAIINAINLLINNNCVFEKQNDLFASYAKKISKKEARVNWKESAVQIERYVRAFNPWPLSFFLVKNCFVKIWFAEVKMVSHNKIPGTILNVDKKSISVATGDGVLNMIKLQPPGKNIMSVLDILNYRKDWFVPENILE